MLRYYSLPVLGLDGGVVVFLGELHAVDEVAHVLAQHLVRHLDLAVRGAGEGGDQAVHRRQQLPQLQPHLHSTVRAANEG